MLFSTDDEWLHTAIPWEILAVAKSLNFPHCTSGSSLIEREIQVPWKKIQSRPPKTGNSGKINYEHVSGIATGTDDSPIVSHTLEDFNTTNNTFF